MTTRPQAELVEPWRPIIIDGKVAAAAAYPQRRPRMSRRFDRNPRASPDTARASRFCLVACAILAGCGGGLPPLPGDRVRASFPPGGIVDVIEISAIDRLPLRSVELVAPDGTVTPAASIAVGPAPAETYSQPFPGSPYTGSAFGFANIPAGAGAAAGAPQAQSRLLAMAATTSIALPDPVAYRRDWRDYRIRLRFGEPPGAVERDIAAPAPPPAE
jgi:hypothetical protein